MKFIPAFLFLLLSFSIHSQQTKWTPYLLDEDQMYADIAYLASDKLEGRTFGSKGEKKASKYIAKRFKHLGVAPAGEKGKYFQSLTVNMDNDPHANPSAKKGPQTGENVIGIIDNKAPYTIVLGAHYDHLGYGDFGSLHAGTRAIHNGADDNASGVALILELAQRFRQFKEHNFLFILFTGEENGLWGSNYYTDHPTINLNDVSAMINFDMVGRLTDNKMAINGTGTSPQWNELIDKNNVFQFTISKTESGIGPSDHTSFYLMDIPSIHFFTGAHEDYHRPGDDVEKINKKGMVMIADMVTNMVRSIGDGGKSKLTFTKTKDPDPSTTPKMEVTLGVLPDYLYDGKGMRIEGVREGKPAEVAGLQKGDVIVALDGVDITDIYKYMEVLGKFHKGDKTTVGVKRGEELLTLNVQF